ncbi:MULTISPECIES: LysR family transcriptional regulator [Vibrio]|uniref:LysR family transcriptional regulator n=1 Tax=Vibrio TaxID=662 RepID=UPI00056FCA93|nr:LysR family transcriptional regulator [Vibrio pacinii]
MRKQLKNIIIFNELYEQGNYREAAANLSMSIATISRAIQELEEDSRVQLFINVKGKFRPTAYAHSLYERLTVNNGELVNSYSLFKSNGRYVNALIPPQMSVFNLVDKLVKFNHEFGTELVINEGFRFSSSEEAYMAMVNGELDFMIDYKPNNSISFVSERIGEHKTSLIASKKYYDSIGSDDINESTKFAKYSWLGQTGVDFQKYFGVAPENQVGFITQNVSHYYKVIKETRFVGVCLADNLKNIEEDFVYEREPFMSSMLYFVTTKAALHNKPVVKWFYDNSKKKEVCNVNQ